MEINYFDLGIAIVVLLLGLKGIINGLFRELFGLIGIIGGIFIASRIGGVIGQAVSDSLFHFDSDAAIDLTGFLVTLALFWIIMIVLGMLFKKMSALSGLGVFDRLLGFVFGSGKFFLIASVIVYALFNIKTIRENLEPSMEGSILYPVMIKTGSHIMHLDPEDMDSPLGKAKAGLDDATDEITKAAKETMQGDATETIRNVKDTIKEQISKDGQH